MTQLEIIRKSRNAFEAGYECAKAAERASGWTRYDLLNNPYDPDNEDYESFQEGKYKRRYETTPPPGESEEG